jgi:photosystem II stability/assembly factor-like uncharacterized protein
VLTSTTEEVEVKDQRNYARRFVAQILALGLISGVILIPASLRIASAQAVGPSWSYPVTASSEEPGSGLRAAVSNQNNPLGLNRWSSNGPEGSIISLAVAPNDPNIIYAGSDVSGVFKSTNGGASWSASNNGLPNRRVTGLAIDPRDPNTIYAAIPASSNDAGLFKSTNGGASWSRTSIPSTTITTVAIALSNPNIIYAGSSDSPAPDFSLNIFVSTNGGETWDVRHGPLNLYGEFVESLVVDPQNSDTLYVYTYDEMNGGPFKSTDGGRNWYFLYSNYYFGWFVIDPSNSNIVYLITGGGIYRSLEGGLGWINLGGGDATALAIDPSNSNTLYAGFQDRGVFKSRDGGASWNAVNDGLTNLNVNALAIDHSGTYLHAGTNAGVFDIQLSVASQPNQIDDPYFFVHQHYRDFLNREPDAPGLAHWAGEITECNDPSQRQPGESLTSCIERKRANTSAAFFLSPEFQNTGSFVLRVYWGTLGKLPSSQCGLPGGSLGQCRPLYNAYLADMSQVAQGIVVNDKLVPDVINANKHAFVDSFVNRSEFKAIYDSLSNQQFVDKLFTTAGITPTDPERSTLVNGLNSGAETRSSVVFKIVDGTQTVADGALVFNTRYGKAFYDQEFDAAFVFMEYVGYLRRNPDQAGYDYWLAKLKLYGNWVDAQMVLAFIQSPEYRLRFAQP